MGLRQCRRAKRCPPVIQSQFMYIEHDVAPYVLNYQDCLGEVCSSEADSSVPLLTLHAPRNSLSLWSVEQSCMQFDVVFRTRLS
eukprot:2980204-Rhodomonas_salina.1